MLFLMLESAFCFLTVFSLDLTAYLYIFPMKMSAKIRNKAKGKKKTAKGKREAYHSHFLRDIRLIVWNEWFPYYYLFLYLRHLHINCNYSSIRIYILTRICIIFLVPATASTDALMRIFPGSVASISSKSWKFNGNRPRISHHHPVALSTCRVQD